MLGFPNVEIATLGAWLHWTGLEEHKGFLDPEWQGGVGGESLTDQAVKKKY